MRYPNFSHERALHSRNIHLVAGVDEVGCGCWAGPVYAAAVILPLHARLIGVRDSKQVQVLQRERLALAIKKCSLAWSIGTASVEEIDTLNIRRASLLASQRALQGLSIQPEWILSDAFPIPGVIPCTAVIRGDVKIFSIAAASIIAKVARDTFMQELDHTFPNYGFAKHKGYGTAQHQQALETYGVCDAHRKTYRPIKKFL